MKYSLFPVHLDFPEFQFGLVDPFFMDLGLSVHRRFFSLPFPESGSY